MLDRHAEGRVGQARCYLFDANDLSRFGVAYLERHFGVELPETAGIAPRETPREAPKP
jgi:hypothetical protein